MTYSPPYFLHQGLEQLAEELTGRENIFLGIRPYGFHAGNKIPFIVYPLLLCELLEKNRKTAEFTFYLFLNDWEQDGFDESYANRLIYPFNIAPKFTTFQYLPAEDGKGSLVDYWESKIINQVAVIQRQYPRVKIRCVRNSYMRDCSVMKEVVLKTIANPNLVSDVLKMTTDRKILDDKSCYCRPICPNCKSAKTIAKIKNYDNVDLECSYCGLHQVYNYHLLHFWLYHKPLALPRIKEFNIDLCVTGMDHYNEGDFLTRLKLFEAYEIEVKLPKTLYTPTLYGRNGKPMGKSKGNYEDIPTEELLSLVRKNPDSSEIYIK